MELTKTGTFETDIGGTGHPVLISFGADWCGPDRVMQPALQALSKAFPDTLKVLRVDIDQDPMLASRFRIRSVPSLVLCRDGETVATRRGPLDYRALVAWVEEVS